MVNKNIEGGMMLDRRLLLTGAAVLGLATAKAFPRIQDASAQPEDEITNEELGMTLSLGKPTNVGETIVEFISLSDRTSLLHLSDRTSHVVVFVDEGKSLVVDGQVGTHDAAEDGLTPVHMGYSLEDPYAPPYWVIFQEAQGTIAVTPSSDKDKLAVLDSLHGDEDHEHIVSEDLEDDFDDDSRPDYLDANFRVHTIYDGGEQTQAYAQILVDGEGGAEVTLESFELDPDADGMDRDAEDRVTVIFKGASVVFRADAYSLE